MSVDTLPQELRQAVESDLQPVQPIASVGRRSLVVAVIAIIFGITGLAALGLRSDFVQLPVWLGWGSAVVGLIFGLILTGLALRESVPGQAISLGLGWILVASAAAFHLVVGMATWKISQGLQLAGSGTEMGLSCMGSEMVLAFPTFAVTLWLVLKSLPIRARLAGLLGATGAIIIADSVNHLHCPVSNPSHVFIWHGGAIVVFAALGWITGWVVERRREANYDRS